MDDLIAKGTERVLNSLTPVGSIQRSSRWDAFAWESSSLCCMVAWSRYLGAGGL